MNIRNSKSLLSLAVCVTVMAIACQKIERPQLGDFVADSNPPGGPLKFYAAFDGTGSDPLRNAVDSMRANFASENPFTSVNGISGRAIQGATSNRRALKYATANDFTVTAAGMTISFWIKHLPHDEGAQFIFSMPKDIRKDSWTPNNEMFLLIEDKNQTTTSKATVKLFIKDQWFEFTNANRIDNLVNGNWHHFVITYDETTSKLTYYVDGVALTGLPASITDVTKDGASGGRVPRGALVFDKVNAFLIGGWNQHAGFPGPGNDPGPNGEGWAKTFSGNLDQFRLYNKALTAAEVTALFNSKR